MSEANAQTTNDLPDRRVPTLQDVLEAGAELVMAQREEESAKQQVKVAKANLKTAQTYLGALMDDSREGRVRNFGAGGDQGPTLFDGDPPSGDDWRDVPLEQLLGEPLPGEDKPHIPDGILKKLAENSTPIVTLGDLTDWVNEKGDFWHKDIAGLGKAAADKITAATDAFWTARQEANRLAETTPPDADDGEEGGDSDA